MARKGSLDDLSPAEVSRISVRLKGQTWSVLDAKARELSSIRDILARIDGGYSLDLKDELALALGYDSAEEVTRFLEFWLGAPPTGYLTEEFMRGAVGGSK